MKISSRFTVAIHVLSLISLNQNIVSTSEWIAESVNTNPVVIRRVYRETENSWSCRYPSWSWRRNSSEGILRILPY